MRNTLSGRAGQVVQARDIGSVTLAAPAIPAAVPALVPAAPATFVDRDSQLRRVRAVAESARVELGRPPVVVLRGMPGVGKTALLQKAAATLSDRFPDGALHAAFGADGDSPAEALGRLLFALGVPEPLLPTDFARRQDLYRSLTAGTRLVTVLDDVTDAAQVEALLPNSGASLVLVAGNSSLEKLYEDGAVGVPVEPLPVEHGVALLAKVCSDGRIDAEPAAAARLVELCGGLPLALRVVGARLAVRPQWTVQRLIGELGETDADSVTDRLAPVFDAVYEDLPEDARTVYRVLGALVGTHCGAELVAAIMGRQVARVREDLEELYLRALIEEPTAGTYVMHRMVRTHALRRSAAEDREEDRATWLSRAVDWWLLGATAADVAVTGWQRLRIADPARLLSPDAVTPDALAGLAWFERELTNILAALEAAAAKRWHDRVWQLFEASFAYFDARRPLASWYRAANVAVESARIAGNAPAEARCRCLRAKALQELERFPQAAADLARARELASGDEWLFASTCDFTGNLALREQRFDDALVWFQKALDINITLGKARGTAMQTVFAGRALAGLGRYGEALETLERAHQLAIAATAESVAAKALLATAAVCVAQGDFGQADRVLEQAAASAKEVGQSAIEAEVATLRSSTARQRGRDEEADRHARFAAGVYGRMGSPRAGEVLAWLGI
ncbi:NB-ARC domain-containing protein [Amycolatopsis sp. NPDC059027]|uniref:NB-ARC domain-containing protein n=1 Tax=Amycolatopsis sp. NPDC059027 TaxID=3346709 RepID=UPI00366EFA55